MEVGRKTCGQVLEEEIITRAPERAPDVRLDARPVNSESWFVNAVDHFHPEGMGGGGGGVVGLNRAEGRPVLCGAGI